MGGIFRCLECGGVSEDAGDALYECAGCCVRFTTGNSADGFGHRCPSCNKYAAKVSDLSCVECEEGVVEEVEGGLDDDTNGGEEAASTSDSGVEGYWSPSLDRHLPYVIRVDGNRNIDLIVYWFQGDWHWREKSFVGSVHFAKWNPIYNLAKWKEDIVRDLRVSHKGNVSTCCVETF